MGKFVIFYIKNWKRFILLFTHDAIVRLCVGHSVIQIEALLWTPSCHMERRVLPSCPPFRFMYMGVELWVNHMG